MRKIFTIGLTVIVAMALISSAALAGESCGAKKKSDAKATVQKASASAGFCQETAVKECSSAMGVSEEECRALCESGELTMVKMSVDGMTCAGCEAGVTSALEKVPGVVKVVKVCHESGSAAFYLDTRKGKSEDAVKAVASKGYKTEIIPAVATVTEMTDAKAAHAGCDPAACASKGKPGCSMTKKTKSDADSK